MSVSEFNPLVSIIIPVYNGSDYMKEAIDSALNQSYSNIEVIVVNDGSKDNEASDEIAKSYGAKIRYFNKENGGVASAFNLGIQKMKGEYFSWLSHDDKYYPNKIEAQIKYLKDLNLNKTETILYSDYDYMDENSKIKGSKVMGNISTEKFRKHLLLEYVVNGNTVLIPKVCFEKVGLFNLDLKTSQDYDMWFRLSRQFMFVHQSERLIVTRRHDEQGSKKISTFFKEGIETKRKQIDTYTNMELIELFDVTSVDKAFRFLAYNFAFRGGDRFGIPLKHVLYKYRSSFKPFQVFKQIKYFFDFCFLFLLTHQPYRKILKKVFKYKV